MNAINIIGVAVLGWLLVSTPDKIEPQSQGNTIYVYVPSEASFDGCGCDICNDCSCTKSQSCSVVKEKEVAVDDAATIFPRPRKPCPSGPGKR